MPVIVYRHLDRPSFTYGPGNKTIVASPPIRMYLRRVHPAGLGDAWLYDQRHATPIPEHDACAVILRYTEDPYWVAGVEEVP